MERKFAVVEKKFDYKGRECIIVFTLHGVRNGYVSVKENKDYCDYDIDCHGGLTYGGELPFYYEPREKYYIGFDCNHYCDGQDYDLALKYNLITQDIYDIYANYDLYRNKNAVCSLEYVEEQCKSIVEQLEQQGIK